MKNKEPENDIPKYKKKTKSNCSKSKSKSDHKHQNKDCLLIADSKPYLASYCTVCGKIRSWNYCLEKCEGGYRELFDEEAFKKYVINDYLHAFKNIEFAVYCPPRDDSNFKIFERVLKVYFS